MTGQPGPADGPNRPQTSIPGVSYLLSPDGLTLSMRWDGPEGSVDSKIGWPDEATAEANYANALTAFERRLPGMIDELRKDPRSSAHRLRRAGRWVFVFGAGKEWAFVPRPTLGSGKLGIYWMRHGVLVRRADRD